MTWLEELQDQLDADSQQRLATNPLRILDSKHPQTQELLGLAPNLEDALSPASQERYQQMKEGLRASPWHPLSLQPPSGAGAGLAAFEITSNALGAQATVCGGGRYDGLVEQLGGAPTACVGWAMGLDRLMLLLGQQSKPTSSPDVVVLSQGDGAEALAAPVARQLCQLGQAMEIDLSGSGLGKQLKRARKSGARWAVLNGEEEGASGQLQLKDLSSAESRSIALAQLAEEWPRL